MALSAAFREARAKSYRIAITSLPSSRLCQRNNATMTNPTSSLPDEVRHNNNKNSLPALNRLSDSSTAAMVSQHNSFMVPTYVRPPLMLVKGKGSYLWDLENRRYLDFTAGIAVNSLGHADPEIVSIISQQSQDLMHVSNLYYNPWIGELSKLLVSRTLDSDGMRNASKVFVCSSGTEANEAALKFARKVGQARASKTSLRKHEIVSFTGSFHGRTMGALSATPNPKYQAPFSPMLPGFRYGTFNDEDSLPKLIGPQTCGVIVEPIQGEGGVNVATPSFLRAIRDYCDTYDAVLIFDEIQCGLSRTGTLWAHQQLSNVHPDVLTTAKALGNGFPVGATVVSEDVASCIVTGDHGTTFGGNPLACRLAHHIVSRLAAPSLQSAVLEKEGIFRSRFSKLQQRFPGLIAEVRGRGLMLGLQMNSDPAPIVTAARDRGLLVITCGTNTLRFVPPLIIKKEEIENGLNILEEAIEAVATRKTV